jgi:hypothetical protein
MSSAASFLRHPLELIASLWDGGSAIVPPVALPSSAPSIAPLADVAAPYAASVPVSLCGWVQSEATPGAPSIWVCQAFGVPMPGLVFLVCIGVAVATLAFLGSYLARSWHLLDELERLGSELREIPRPTDHSWASKGLLEKVVALLAGAGKRVSPLAEGAERIRLGSVALEDSRVVLKKPASTLIGGEAALDAWTGRSLANVLPGWLTAIGLMTTFIALLLGLQNVRVLTNLEVQGIGGLINGLSGKFLSSITALGCAIAVSMVNHSLSRRTNDKWRSLLGTLDGLLPHLNSEALLLELLKGSRRG